MLNVAFEILINMINCGIMSGKPRIGIIAAFCCAFAATAARKLNTRLRLHPPSKTNPANTVAFSAGLEKNMLNKSRLIALISSISRVLKANFARIKCCGLTID